MMKKLVYSLIASLCLVGCSEDMNEMPQNGLAQQGSVKTLTATVGEAESRTSLGDEGAVLWSATDAIALTDGTTWAEYTLTDGAGEASATFQATDATVPEAGTYYAYYPAENVTAVSGNAFTVTLPATQTYTAGSFAPDALPMVAVSTSTSFEFKHVCGLLKLTLQNEGRDALSLSKVIVSANEPMSGTATVTCGDYPEAKLTEGGAVTVAFSEPLALPFGESVVVYVALPVKGTYTNAKISVITADDKYRTFSGAVDRRFSIQRAKFSKVDLNLKSEEMTALPEMSASYLKVNLGTAVTSAGEEISSVKSIVFQPNETINSSSGCEIDYDNATKTATVKFAAPIVKLDADATYMFSGMTSLESVDLSCFDTSKVTNMSAMFYGCQDLTSITFGNNFNTGKVTDMSSMFNGCMALTSLDLSNFDTANVTYMSRMFSDCSGLTSLDLSNFDTSNVTDMSSMFNRCSGLTSITFGNNFDTGKVTNMSAMFNGCIALTSLDLSHFDTGKVTDMSYMFYYCSDLSSLNLSSFTTDALTGYSTAFTYVPADCAITISSALNDLVGDQLTDYTAVTVVTEP